MKNFVLMMVLALVGLMSFDVVAEACSGNGRGLFRGRFAERRQEQRENRRGGYSVVVVESACTSAKVGGCVQQQTDTRPKAESGPRKP